MKYCEPLCAGKESEPRKVGRYIGNLLDALDYVNSNRIKNHGHSIVKACNDLQYQVMQKLRAEGWTIKVNNNGNKWQVLPPK